MTCGANDYKHKNKFIILYTIFAIKSVSYGYR